MMTAHPWKKASTEVTLYACGNCGNKHASAELADECCVCRRCGKAPVRTDAHRHWKDDKCRRCFLIERIRDVRADIKRMRGDLESREKHLAELQAEKDAVEAEASNPSRAE